MAFSLSKNDVLFVRIQEAAKAFQNLWEEAQRLKKVKSQEAQGNVAHVNTAIATVAELDVFISYLTDFCQFNDGTGTGALAIARWGWLLPFIDTTSA